MQSQASGRRSGTTTIITPIYGTSLAYFEECAASVASACRCDAGGLLDEWVVVSDGDTRDLEAVLAELTCGLDLRCTFLDLGRRAGLSEARNEGVNVSSSTYITWLDADDVLIPEGFVSFLSLATRILEGSYDALMVISDNVESDAALSPMFVRRKDWVVEAHRARRGARGDPLLCIDFVYQAQLIRRTDFDAVGGYSADRIGEDVDLVLRLFEANPDRCIYHVPEIAYNYRANPEGIVATRRAELRAQNALDYSRVQRLFWDQHSDCTHTVTWICPDCEEPHLVPVDQGRSQPFFNCFVPEGWADRIKHLVREC